MRPRGRQHTSDDREVTAVFAAAAFAIGPGDSSLFAASSLIPGSAVITASSLVRDSSILLRPPLRNVIRIGKAPALDPRSPSTVVPQVVDDVAFRHDLVLSPMVRRPWWFVSCLMPVLALARVSFRRSEATEKSLIWFGKDFSPCFHRGRNDKTVKGPLRPAPT